MNNDNKNDKYKQQNNKNINYDENNNYSNDIYYNNQGNQNNSTYDEDTYYNNGMDFENDVYQNDQYYNNEQMYNNMYPENDNYDNMNQNNGYYYNEMYPNNEYNDLQQTVKFKKVGMGENKEPNKAPKNNDKSNSTKVIVAVVVAVTLIAVAIIIFANNKLNNPENEFMPIEETKLTESKKEVKEETKLSEIEETEITELKKTQDAILDRSNPSVNQKAMGAGQVTNWVNEVLMYREEVGDISELNSKGYQTSLTYGNQSSDRLVYVEVYKGGGDLFAIFRINSSGYLEELNKSTGNYEVISTYYGNVGKEIN